MDYEALKELVKLISRHKSKDIELLGSGSGKDAEPKLNQLYDGIMRGQLTNDDESAVFLYGPEATASHPDYRRLRNRLIRQLLNTSFFMDMHQPIYTERAKMSYQIYKDFAAAALLLSRDARRAGIYLMEQVVDTGIKYEFIELVADASRMIRTTFSGSMGDAHQYAKYTEIHQKYEEKRRHESTAFEAYQNVIRPFIGGASNNNSGKEQTQNTFQELIEKAPVVDTANYYFYAFSVGIAHYSSSNNAQQALDLCNQAIHSIGQKEQFVKGKMLAFILNKLHFMTQLKSFDLEEGRKTYELCLSQVSEGETNWFKTLNTWLQFNLHAGEYATALKIYLQAVNHPRFPVMTGLTSEIWKIYFGYFQLLIALKKLPVTEGIGEFKEKKFLNDFPVLSKEKTGMYIPILLLPVIFSLVANEEIKSVDGLDKFRQRNLQNEQNLRSAIFVKLLIALGKRPYEQEKANKKIQLELSILSTVPIGSSGQSHVVEIIPYEILWEMLASR